MSITLHAANDLEGTQVVIMDVDGTLASAEHRIHLLPTKDMHGAERDAAWQAFLGAAHLDPVHEEIRLLSNAMSEHALIFVVTGRDQRDEEITRAWLEANEIHFDELHMRPLGDRREDCEVKEKILESFRARNAKVLFAVEDRARVTAMWRRNGVRCLQVCEGNY